MAPIKFHEILKIHKAETLEGSHSDILGDGFLISANPVYRTVKNHAIKVGFTFSEATSQYLLLPFNHLDQIVTSKIVPYVPHARLMAEIEAKHPDIFDLQQMPMPESYHLHEAGHVIAENCCARIKVTTQQDQILKSILCESFANSVDAMACGFAESETHRLFLKLNCYMNPTTEVQQLINSVRVSYGNAFTARLILISYLHSNFLHEDVPMEYLGAGKDDENCRELSTIGQELDMLFRVHTTQNYFHLMGLKGEIIDLVNFDFMQRLQRPDFASAFEDLVEILAS